MTVLGISVGTARTAVCVIRDGELLDRNLHSDHSPWSDHKLRVIVNRYRAYFRYHDIRAVIAKVPPPEKHTKAVRQAIRQIEKLAKKHGCAFDIITKQEMKHTYGLRSTRDIIEYATRLYPELNAMFENGSESGHGHHKKVYEAVLAAHVFRQRLSAK